MWKVIANCSPPSIGQAVCSQPVDDPVSC